MNKLLRLILVFLLVVGFFFSSIPHSASSYFAPSSSPTLAQGDWSTGSNTEVNFVENPMPNWLQLLTSPVEITESGQVCHAFRGGQFGWVGEIRQLVDGNWVKVASTAGWVPNEEGIFTICFDANTAGTYALFGYFNPPKSYYPNYVEPPAAAPSPEPV